MNTKIVGISLVLVLVISSLAFATVPSDEKQELSVSQSFSPPSLIETDDSITIHMEGVDGTLYQAGEPMVPMSTEVLTFPLGTKITGITCIPYNIHTIPLTKDIPVAPDPIPLGLSENPVSIQMPASTAALSQESYPSDWFTYHLGVGRVGMEQVLFLSLHIYPCRYYPVSSELRYLEDITITIDYMVEDSPLPTNDAYNLLIISPTEFANELSILAAHKESRGLATKLVTMDEIYNNDYFPIFARDDAEMVKYFIKNALEEWGIDYVLLVGGLKSKIIGDTWYIPVRYSNLADREGYSEYSYLTDLYFADIYKIDEEGNLAFEDWDSNKNGIFGEWPSFGGSRDDPDMYPDVYVGRLACRDVREVQTVVEKIVTYESGQNPSWFKRVVLAGGDTFNDIDGYNYLEGEIANQRVAEILSGFEAERIWWTAGNFKPKNVVNAISKGCGFVHLSGHGSPEWWMAKDFTEDPNGEYLSGLNVYQMPLLSNEGQYPIVVIGGCHNSMFNVTSLGSLIGCIKSLTGSPTWYWMPTPECFGWWLVKQPDGGAIATFGCTGLGLGTIGDSNHDNIPDSIQYLGTWLELRFFEAYAHEGISILGEAYGTAITDYLNTFDCHKSKGDRKTIEEWALLGDPSLMIGGY